MDSQGTRDERIRVLVADNTRIHTQLLADALKRDRGLDVLSADSDSHALIATAAAHKADVLVISSNLDEESHRAFEVVRELRASHPQIRAVMLLDSSKREFILNAFRAGARGIFSRHESVDSLCKCVRSVQEGQIWASSLQMSFAVEALAASPTVRAVDANGLNLLSKRETEVVHSLAEGLTNREIAERLGLSQHTIKNYLFKVFDKLGVSSRMELLCLTLTQPAEQAAAIPGGMIGGTNSLERADGSDLAAQERAAEQGAPHAQMALAQMYSQGKQVEKNPVAAYTWYLAAEQTMVEMKDVISHAKRKLAESLTTEEILEAQQKAAARLKKSAQPASHNSQDGANANAHVLA